MERGHRDHVAAVGAGERTDLGDAVERVARLTGVVPGCVDVAVGVAPVLAGDEQQVALAAAGGGRVVAPPLDRVWDDAVLRALAEIGYRRDRHGLPRTGVGAHRDRRPRRELASEELAPDREGALDRARVGVARDQLDHVGEPAARHRYQLADRLQRDPRLLAGVAADGAFRRCDRLDRAADEDELAGRQRQVGRPGRRLGEGEAGSIRRDAHPITASA